jgi:hypothetical protein
MLDRHATQSAVTSSRGGGDEAAAGVVRMRADRSSSTLARSKLHARGRAAEPHAACATVALGVHGMPIVVGP